MRSTGGCTVKAELGQLWAGGGWQGLDKGQMRASGKWIRAIWV